MTSINSSRVIKHLDETEANKRFPRAISLGMVDGEEIKISSVGSKNTIKKVHRHSKALNIAKIQIKKNQAIERLRQKLAKKVIEIVF